jgi:energy-coupling factor transporter ATP-binding protein EcfA2
MAVINGVTIDDITAQQIPRIRRDVLKKDRDKFIVIDGREGTGKSVFAMQLAKVLDADFNIDKIAFNADTFIKLLKSKDRKKGDCILLDEAFSSANSRSSLSQINRAMMTVATEMRQLNLFIIMVLPTFFDLDKYFAIWRCETLFHVYYNKKGKRGQYIIFPFNKKKMLYIKGKKLYNYGLVKSPYPPCSFTKQYVVEEKDYRLKKASAFKKRETTITEKKWRERTRELLKYLRIKYNEPEEELGKLVGMRQNKVNRLVNKGW